MVNQVYCLFDFLANTDKNHWYFYPNFSQYLAPCATGNPGSALSKKWGVHKSRKCTEECSQAWLLYRGQYDRQIWKKQIEANTYMSWRYLFSNFWKFSSMTDITSLKWIQFIQKKSFGDIWKDRKKLRR